jgi:hypothetical protein
MQRNGMQVLTRWFIEVSVGGCVFCSCDDCYDQEDSEEEEGFIGGVFIR